MRTTRAPREGVSRTQRAMRCLLQPLKMMGLGRPIPRLTSEPLPSSSSTRLDPAVHFVQRTHQCGPCVSAAAISHITKKRVHPDTISSQRVICGLRGTAPYDQELLLRSHGVQVQTYNASGLTREHQYRFLQQELARLRIVALMTEMYEQLHYIALLGYDQDAFIAYDPLCVNDDIPGITRTIEEGAHGNCRIQKEKVIDDWRKACFHKYIPLYRGYAAVLS